MRLKKYLLIFSFLLILISGTHCSKTEEKTSQAEEVIPVRVDKVKKRELKKTVRYLGDIKANNHVEVYATIPNKITEIRARVNDYVEEGDLLATVKNTQMKQNVKKARAALNSARSKYQNILSEWKRNKKLYQQNAISESQFEAIESNKESAKSAVEQAEAGLESAQERLSDTRIKAPISGIISARNFDLGDQPAQQRPVYKIVAIDKVKILVNIAEEDIGSVDKGAQAIISVSSFPNTKFRGKVSKIYPTINPQTRSTNAEIILSNKNHKLRPGMYATVNIIIEQENNTLVVPNYAIIEKTSREYLGGELTNSKINIDRSAFIIDNNRAKRIDIKPGIITDDYTEVIQGLSAGDKIVTRGEQNLNDGSKVEIIE